MIAAGALAKGWLVALAIAAAHGTLLAICALVWVRAARPRPAWQAAVWLVVIAKLALPWGPATAWSLADRIAGLFDARTVDAAAALPPVLRGAAPEPSSLAALGWIVLGAVWLVGAAIVVVRAARRVRGERAVVRAAQPAPEAVTALAGELAARVGVRPPRIVVGDAATGPHVTGAWRTTIVVPPALTDDAVLLRGALLHELAHVRRRDTLARGLQLVAAALLWWWPVARLASRRLELARETACDAWALEAGDVPRAAYARLLVAAARLRAVAPALASPVALDARVAAVLAAPVRARLGLVQRAVLAGGALIALGGARSADARGHAPACRYSVELATALYAAHPEADLDGDGVLSRDEACELQATLRQHPDQLASPLEEDASVELRLLNEPLCCNRPPAEAYSPAEGASCPSVEGALR